jgi:choline monooxygenase
VDQIYWRPDRSVDRFDRDPEFSYTIPAHLYFDPGVLEEEKSRIFRKSWQLAGHASDLRLPGSYVTVEVAGQQVAVVRGKAGELSAFFNVCQHRGHLLLHGKGQIKNVITCPYHAWAYDHAGHLVAAPKCQSVKGFDKADFTIPAVRVEEFFGFVFVNLDPDARPMRDVYPGLEQFLGTHIEHPGGFNRLREIAFDIKGNWKNVGDNALECYHCDTAHKAFVDLVDMDSYRVECFDNWSMQIGDCRSNNTAYNYEGAEVCGGQFVFVFMFPALALTRFAGAQGIFTFSFLPTAPEMTHQVANYYGPGDELTAAEAGMMDYFNDVLGPEDVSLVENVQKGLHSDGYYQGRFIIDESRGATGEHAVHHFHSMFMEALG